MTTIDTSSDPQDGHAQPVEVVCEHPDGSVVVRQLRRDGDRRIVQVVALNGA